jgi:hydroxyacylglutathione hydrolase
MPMKTLLAAASVVAAFQVSSLAQAHAAQIEGREVFKNDEVVFHQIDEHTWVGSGHMMASESLYLLEGSNKAVLIDAGTTITGLDRTVASLRKKPVMLVVTHAHPDHTGSEINDFPELSIRAGDAASPFVSAYKGTIKPLKDGNVIDLGGRTLDVVATPGHTQASTTFKVKREPNPRGMMGLNMVITANGVRINCSENSVK